MAEHDPQAQERNCKHYLWLTMRWSRDGMRLWAKCRHCKRAWMLGLHADVIAGLSRFEDGADF